MGLSLHVPSTSEVQTHLDDVSRYLHNQGLKVRNLEELLTKECDRSKRAEVVALKLAEIVMRESQSEAAREWASNVSHELLWGVKKGG